MLPRGMRPFAERLVSMRETQSEAEDLSEAQELLEAFQSPELQHVPESIFPDSSIVPEATGSFQLRLEEGGAPVEQAPFIIPEGIKSVEEILMMVENEPAYPLNPGIELPDDGLHLKDHLAEIEKGLILQALNRSDGNISQTARLLRLQRTTLIEKINKYGLRPD
jgi:DNA-binding NtrC family response regulator